MWLNCARGIQLCFLLTLPIHQQFEIKIGLCSLLTLILQFYCFSLVGMSVEVN